MFAQEDAWVYFNDKPSEASYFTTPLNMLTQRSLDRRARYGIALDSKDVPLEPTYVSQINSSVGITILARSKWLNALHIQGSKAAIDNLLNLSFIESIEYANRLLTGSKPSKTSNIIKKGIDKLKFESTVSYGSATNQIEMLGGETLHQNNFTGAGMQIAVIDAGFPGVNTFSAFKRIRDNGQILGGYDFVARSSDIYTGSSHGTSVLSTIAGYLEIGVDGATANFTGTAPDADFYLFRTENAPVEVRLEESLWVEAAERADSLGVDVINTSLGYSVFFDNPDHNYSYEDMDGQTAFITRGAEVAFSRGMLLVTSAGNEGGDAAWPYINAPADGPSVLTVGAVNSEGIIASFSSFGPSADNRTKPDVLAQGQGTYLINSAGNVDSGNGTSFSSPVLTGVVACLWQAFPDKTNAEITQLIKESAHLYTSPTNQKGYGIPNFTTIYQLLSVNIDDLDGDGVLNTFDACPNTPEGAEVDTNGCLVLPSDNFKLEVTGETCPDKNNGQISFSSETAYNYLITVDGLNYSLTNSTFNLLDLSPGDYEMCVTLENQNYEQCYNFDILEGVLVSGKASISSKSVIVELDKGTPPYTVYLNGLEKLQTLNSIFEIAIKPGDIVEVKTSIACEGVFSKEIAAEAAISVYPNPINNIVNFKFPNDVDKIEISIYNLLGNTIYQGQILKNNPTTDISFLSKGFYLMQVKSNNEIRAFKVLKN
ncbi:Por secretion system C-terminal sorting domain-containing protein [Lutibacter flavus]|uniref:Por secretion system C-terminal sorting domain-containing protein n=1 Tax=Lutibacter flavus TaxID=691689 RepID=A0A238W0Y0_9FLAO|nr:Por secretion system C-terminal sorting domain-containing protein [Lutibacter flavus]